VDLSSESCKLVEISSDTYIWTMLEIFSDSCEQLETFSNGCTMLEIFSDSCTLLKIFLVSGTLVEIFSDRC